MPRVGIASGVQLSTYETSKGLVSQAGVPSGILNHFLSSCVSGLAVSTAISPFDVISTRLYNQTGTTYSGVVDCFVKTIKAEGLRGLYKGWLPQFTRIGPHTVLTFVFWEQLKRIWG